MKRTVVLGLLLGVVMWLAAVVVQRSASANKCSTDGNAIAGTVTAPVPVAKKCSFDSDCSYGKCSGGQCGACGFDSDCKGYGKCSGGHCGSCNFDSDCKDFGGCSSGHCAKSPG